MKLSVGSRVVVDPMADTVDVLHHLTYTDIVILQSAGDDICAELAQCWLDLVSDGYTTGA